MYLPTYPDTDSALSAAEHRGARELCTTVQVERPWLEHPGTLVVRYHGPQSLSVAEVAGLQIPLDAPLRLQPVRVEKPWGEEIWFSGIETRGESRVGIDGGSLPLLDYLSLAPQRLCRSLPLLLLKVLRSKSEPIAGELYFEIHRSKRETYVVLSIDPAMYPDGRGAVRFGMNQAKRRAFADDVAFRRAFLDAVRRCESQGSAARLADSPSRAEMLSFVASRTLRVGDSLAVDNGVPHSLQPGLEVLEFQTPDFERQIIFASQPVATQSGWNTAEAVPAMSISPAPEPVPATATRIASFPEFSVNRLFLAAAQPQPQQGSPAYALCFSETGRCHIRCAAATLTLEVGQAAFIPGSARDVVFSTDQNARLLVATPES